MLLLFITYIKALYIKMCLLHTVLHATHILLLEHQHIISRKCELIQPIAKVLDLWREYLAVNRNPIKLFACSPRLGTLSPEMREMLLYNCFLSFFLVSLRGFLLSTLAVVDLRHLILPVIYTELIFHTACYEFSTRSLQVICGETEYCHVVCRCKARCLKVKHSSS